MTLATRLFAPMLLMLAAFAAQAEDAVQRFYGYAYDLKTGKYIYTEVHEQRTRGTRWVGGSIKYFKPDGSALANKTLDFSVDPYIPIYTLSIPGEGYGEAITAVKEGEITMTKTSGGKSQTEETKRLPGMAADSGFHSFIVDHFADLLAGKTIQFPFAVAGQLTTYRFRAKKTGEAEFDGKQAVRLLVEPDSLLRIVADPLILLYDVKEKRLLEFRGISNMHDPATGKAYNARIIYPDKPPADAPKNLPSLE